MTSSSSTPTKPVLILGNGFDLDLGLKTSYKSFYESKLCPKDYPSPLIAYLNRSFDGNLGFVKWYDLENELFNYYNSRFKGVDIISDEERSFILRVFPKDMPSKAILPGDKYIYQTLKKKGIIQVTNRFVTIPYREDIINSTLCRDRISLKKIKDGLCSFMGEAGDASINNNSLAYCVLSLMVNYMKKRSGTLKVYSFNYTSLPAVNGENIKGNNVHGCCSKNNVIIGTGDETIDPDYDFLQKSFDKTFSPPNIVDSLDSADSIVIFGHSLGYNDKQYFKPFFTKQAGFGKTTRKRITIITKDDDSVQEIKRSLQKMTDNNLSVLMSRNTVRFVKTDLIKTESNSLMNFFREYGVSKKEDRKRLLDSLYI